MKKKLSLLSEAIIKCHSDNFQMLFQGSEFTKVKEKELLGFVPEEKQFDFDNELSFYAWEYYWGGIIDGFRMCKCLLDELDQFEEPDFLKDLLMSKPKEMGLIEIYATEGEEEDE